MTFYTLVWCIFSLKRFLRRDIKSGWCRGGWWVGGASNFVSGGHPICRMCCIVGSLYSFKKRSPVLVHKLIIPNNFQWNSRNQIKQLEIHFTCLHDFALLWRTFSFHQWDEIGGASNFVSGGHPICRMCRIVRNLYSFKKRSPVLVHKLIILNNFQRNSRNQIKQFEIHFTCLHGFALLWRTFPLHQ